MKGYIDPRKLAHVKMYSISIQRKTAATAIATATATKDKQSLLFSTLQRWICNAPLSSQVAIPQLQTVSKRLMSV